MGCSRRKPYLLDSPLFKVLICVAIVAVDSVYSKSYVIDTTAGTIYDNATGASSIDGAIVNRSFTGPNEERWNYSVAEFNLITPTHKAIFSTPSNKITIQGKNALSLRTTGNLTIGTKLHVSGRAIQSGNSNVRYYLGGFIRASNSCCVLGAGPGAGFSYHGGGHGGRGGGYYQDRNTSRYYGWNYHNMEYLLGGSTGSILLQSRPVSGSGGGAIEIQTNDTLTVASDIKSHGYSSQNTTSPHCAGSSSGGLIRLSARKVIITDNGALGARGGDAGFSSNHSNRCGGGGGGGVIQVFTLTDNKDYEANSTERTAGGLGIDRGEDGVEWVGVFFDSGDLEINTTACSMMWKSILLHQGDLKTRSYRNQTEYKVCHFSFSSSIHLGKSATVKISGKYAMKISSAKGNVEVYCSVDVSGKIDALGDHYLGGFVNSSSNGPGRVTGCNATGLYDDDFDSLIGGSVCGTSGSSTKAAGGGAIEFVALKGKVIIGATISADGKRDDHSTIGAMGGTIRLKGRTVVLDKNAVFTAKPSAGSLAGGGVIQIQSQFDVEGLCESKFEVRGGRSNGVVQIRVSARWSYQVQFVQSGILEIDTTTRMWTHQAEPNSTIMYSYYGTPIKTNHQGMSYSSTLFEFRTPIIINGSAKVKVSGRHGLSIHSKEGIYIGVNLKLTMEDVHPVESFVGGFCVSNASSSSGSGPGRGYPSGVAGAGHGGKGGQLQEVDNVVYSDDYGIHSDALIGGSTGSARGDRLGCGGAAIKISTPRNLTLNAAIIANGFAKSGTPSSSYGGSSGGTIILKANQVIFESGVYLFANGSDASPPNANDTGGGAGGVIVITTQLSSSYPELSPDKNTKGGRGGKDGENGVIIINGKVFRIPVPINDTHNYTGCYHVTSDPKSTKDMLAHQANPRFCVQWCDDTAAVRGKTCRCYVGSEVIKEPVSGDYCNKTCPSTNTMVCGGTGDSIFSFYTTGHVQPPTTPLMATEPTTIDVEPTTTTTRSPGEPSQEFMELANATITANNSFEMVKNLNNLTSSSTLNGGDTRVAINVLEKLAKGKVLSPSNASEAKIAGQAVIEIVSTLMAEENAQNWQTLEAENTTDKVSPYSILKTMEQIGVGLGSNLKENDNFTMESEVIAMGIEVSSLSNFQGGFYPRYSMLTRSWMSDDQIYIPKQTVDQLKNQGESRTTAVYVIYNGNSISSLLNSGVMQQDMQLNSKVLAFSFDKPLHQKLDNPVQIKFRKYKDWKNISKLQCSFIDFQQSSYDWSDEGCNLTSTTADNDMAECDCNHLTNFAILMQVKEITISKAHEKALQMITYVGCGISLFGLALTLATFLSLETLASERTSIHKNLVVAIGLAQIVFLAGIDSANPIACTVVALSLHYLYTAAFAWMCCEGVHLYTKVIEVFSSEGSKMKYYYLLGWGAPLIIVIISAAVRSEGYGVPGKACWISIKGGLIWAFVGPVLVIMAVNFVVMVMVIKVILASVTSIQNPTNTSQVKAGLKGMVVLLPLLGLTWLFGLMAVDEQTIAFQYIFAILNSLQGLFIFAFHCIGNSEVRVAYRRLHEKRTINKSLPEHSLSSVQHNKDMKRRMNSRDTNSTGDEDVIVTKAIRSVSDVKLSGDHVAMQTFGDTDSGRWSLNCPSPDAVENFHSRRL